MNRPNAKFLKPQGSRLVSVLLLLTLGSCTTVGKGRDTLVPCEATPANQCSGLARFFPDLVNGPDLRALTPDATLDRNKYVRYLTRKLGTSSVSGADMSLVVRNRTIIPPFMPTDLHLQKELLPLFAKIDISEQQKRYIFGQIENKFYFVPDLPDRTTERGQPGTGGYFDYYYYPRIKLDFTSKLQSPSQLDRFAYMGVVLVLSSSSDRWPFDPMQKKSNFFDDTIVPEEVETPDGNCRAQQPTSDECAKALEKFEEYKSGLQRVNQFAATCKSKQAKFINYLPKEADIVEFTRGQLTQSAQFQANASLSETQLDKITNSATDSIGSTALSGTTVGSEPNVATSSTSATETNLISTGSERSQTDVLSRGLSVNYSESFVNALKDSIEARTSGILDGGQAFYADFRSIKNRRIGGTYEFDLMLEVPSVLFDFRSVPCTDLIVAHAYLVSVVRHVWKRGLTGVLTRVPEPENDYTYHQVIAEQSDVVLWNANEAVLWANPRPSTDTLFTFVVTTNDADARFVVRSNSGVLYGAGEGKKSSIAIDTGKLSAPTECLIVDFLSINKVSQGNIHTLTAQSSQGACETVSVGDSGKLLVTGNYRP